MSRTAIGEQTLRLVRKEKIIELRISQLKVETIGKAFSVNPSTVWLREEIGHRAFFPEENGTFAEMEDMVDEVYSLIVEGTDSTKESCSPEPKPSGLIPCAATKETNSNNQQYSTGISKRGPIAVSVKIMLANMRLGPQNKPEFTPIDVAYCEVTEDTANAPYISSFIKQQFGDNYVLTSNDGLEIKDFSGTRGK